MPTILIRPSRGWVWAITRLSFAAENLGNRYHIGAQQTKDRTIREALTEAVAASPRQGDSSSGNAESHIWDPKDIYFEIYGSEVEHYSSRTYVCLAFAEPPTGSQRFCW